MVLEDRPTIGEQYAKATESKDLSPSTERRTDADVLLAAGIAASRDPRRMLALKVYRLAVGGETDGLVDIVETADDWLQGRLARGGNRPMRAEARRALVMDTLHWWIRPTCNYCEGRGFVTVPDTARLSTVACESCHGSGRRPLAREVPHAHVKHATWMADELDRLVALICSDMAKLLSTRRGLR
jgi:hypothetical protein